MNFLSIQKALLTDANENTMEAHHILEQTYIDSEKAVVGYLSANCVNGFHQENAIQIFPNIRSNVSYFAIENHSPFWCRPTWGDDLTQLPKKVQELLLYDGNTYRAILPLCGDTFKTVIRGTDEGLSFCSYANFPVKECKRQPAFLMMEGADPLALLLEIAQTAGKLLKIPMREERPVADLFNTFGWCSWDAMQIRVNHEGMLEKAKEFQEKSIPVQFAILDDMWADVPMLNEIPHDVSFGDMVATMHKSKLRRFEGDPKRFPNGIKETVDGLHDAGIPNVGIWFPTTGYWAGLETGCEIEMQEKEKANAYFLDLCQAAKKWGANFVKIDNQGFHERYRNIAPIGQSANAIQSAIDSAANACFDGALINCMGMPSECMYNRTSAVSRCSDDFMPESRPWFAKNILQCAYNGLLQGQFYVNDWDMWWTDDEQAVKNSLCRAISGGPIYVSDKIGRTKAEILKPLLLKNGRILRPDESAIPTSDCIMDNPKKAQKIFKIRNRVGENGLVAVFNIYEENQEVTGFVSPKNAGLPTGTYGYYEYFTGENGILAYDQELPVSLSTQDDFRLYIFAPMKNGIATLGRTDLFVGVKAITEQSDHHISVCEEGSLGFISEKPYQFSDENQNSLSSKRTGFLSVVFGKNIFFNH